MTEPRAFDIKMYTCGKCDETWITNFETVVCRHGEPVLPVEEAMRRIADKEAFDKAAAMERLRDAGFMFPADALRELDSLRSSGEARRK